MMIAVFQRMAIIHELTFSIGYGVKMESTIEMKRDAKKQA